MMLRDIDSAFVAPLVNTSYADRLGDMVVQYGSSTITAPVTFGLVEEFLQAYVRPSVNVLRLPPKFDVTRFDPNLKDNQYTDSTKSAVTVSRPPYPYLIPYQIDVITDYQSDLMALVTAIQTRIPPFGFGSCLNVDSLVLPYRATDERDLTSYQTKERRMFRYTFTYVVEGWLDPEQASAQTFPTVTSVNVSTSAVDKLPNE